MKAPKFNIEIKSLGSGWLSVTLLYGEHKYEFHPSYTPYDSIYELTASLYRVISSFGDATAKWNDEPVEHEFNFSKLNNIFSLEVLKIEEGKFELNKTKVFQIKGTLNEVIKPIWRSLRKLETKQSYEEYQEAMRRLFPREELRKLTEKIKSIR